MPENNYLVHYGIKGMKWGKRRFQNKDGSLTPAGARRYNAAPGESGGRDEYKPKRNEKKNPNKKSAFDMTEKEFDARSRNYFKSFNEKTEQEHPNAEWMWNPSKDISNVWTNAQDNHMMVLERANQHFGIESPATPSDPNLVKAGRSGKNDSASTTRRSEDAYERDWKSESKRAYTPVSGGLINGKTIDGRKMAGAGGELYVNKYTGKQALKPYGNNRGDNSGSSSNADLVRAGRSGNFEQQRREATKASKSQKGSKSSSITTRAKQTISQASQQASKSIEKASDWLKKLLGKK